MIERTALLAAATPRGRTSRGEAISSHDMRIQGKQAVTKAGDRSCSMSSSSSNSAQGTETTRNHKHTGLSLTDFVSVDTGNANREIDETHMANENKNNDYGHQQRQAFHTKSIKRRRSSLKPEDSKEDGSTKRASDENQISLHHAENHGEVEEAPPRATWNQIRGQCICQCKIHESMIQGRQANKQA